MTKASKPPHIRVYYSNGDVFHVRPCTAGEFVLDPIFLQFIVLSVFMYTALMMVFDVPAVAQMVLFGAGVVASFFWLTVGIVIYLAVQRKRDVVTIFTPVLYVPMQLFNTATCELVLRTFGSTYLNSLEGLAEFFVRTIIIIVCLDIIHGKFVVPLNKLYLSPEDAEGRVPASPPIMTPAAQPELHAPQVAAIPVVATGQAPVSDVAPPRDATEHAATSAKVSIGSESFPLHSLEYINSEDHYLMVHHADKSTMVRGRLRDVAAQIDVSWGVQINRSVWVAFAAITAVTETSDKRLEVTLKDDVSFRLAESRRVHFLHTYEQHSKMQSQT